MNDIITDFNKINEILYPEENHTISEEIIKISKKKLEESYKKENFLNGEEDEE